VERDTIVNCWTHAGIVPRVAGDAAAHLAHIDAIMADIQRDLGRLAAVAAPNDAAPVAADARALVAVDSDEPIEEEAVLDDDAIVGRVLEMSADDADADEDSSEPPPPVSAASAAASLSIVISFFEQSSTDRNAEIAHLRAMLENVEQARTQSMRQASIRSFFI
jgi:hypothetical protein